MSAEETRLIRWLLLTGVVAALLLALLAYLGLPLVLLLATRLYPIV